MTAKSATKRGSIEAVIARAEKARDEWLAEYERDVEAKVERRLNERLDAVVAGVLGFSNRWGRWEVDHCNGRSGESILGVAIRDRARKAVETWVSDVFNGGRFELTAAQRAAIKREFSDAIEYEARSAAERLAAERAALLVREIVGEENGDV